MSLILDMKNHYRYMMCVRVLVEPSNMCSGILWCVVLQNKSRILFEEEGGIIYAAQISSKILLCMISCGRRCARSP